MGLIRARHIRLDRSTGRLGSCRVQYWIAARSASETRGRGGGPWAAPVEAQPPVRLDAGFW